jgi:large subunit ribosomal protein L11
MKKLVATIKLQIPAGKASPAGKIGQGLGPHGLNLMEFCKQFNAKTQKYAEDGFEIPAIISVFADRSFALDLKSPTTAALLKKAAGLSLAKKPASGSKEPNKKIVGKVTEKQVESIAKMKIGDTNASSTEGCMNMIKGTAKSMGIEVVS